MRLSNLNLFFGGLVLGGIVLGLLFLVAFWHLVATMRPHPERDWPTWAEDLPVLDLDAPAPPVRPKGHRGLHRRPRTRP